VTLETAGGGKHFIAGFPVAEKSFRRQLLVCHLAGNEVTDRTTVCGAVWRFAGRIRSNSDTPAVAVILLGCRGSESGR
jgi:hypothetical protein